MESCGAYALQSVWLYETVSQGGNNSSPGRQEKSAYHQFFARGLYGIFRKNRIEYTAKASYANWPSLLTEGYQELTENLDEYTYAEEAFVLVKENGNWLVEEFTLPN